MAGFSRQICGVNLRSHGPRISKQSNQNEKPDLGQESDAHYRDRKEHVACRERVHECLAPSEAPASKSLRREKVSVPIAGGARCERRRHPRGPKGKSARGNNRPDRVETGLPKCPGEADIPRVRRHASNVPTRDIAAEPSILAPFAIRLYVCPVN